MSENTVVTREHKLEVEYHEQVDGQTVVTHDWWEPSEEQWQGWERLGDRLEALEAGAIAVVRTGRVGRVAACRHGDRVLLMVPEVVTDDVRAGAAAILSPREFAALEAELSAA